ncbi:MAG: radical SAM protein [Candidatus Omnitrophica bacterium]|nr:radical SAM protein [Candidatus Omnitrophota bacterium]
MKILLVVYDNDAFLHQFPLGTAYIAAALRKAGHDVTIYQQDVYHMPEDHLTAHLDGNNYDMVGVGVIGGYYQYRKLLKISDSINRSRKRPLYVIGGHGPSPEPAYFLKKTGADAVVIGEGENTIVELCRAIESKSPWEDVKGIAYMDNKRGKFQTNGERALIKDLDLITHPAWELFDINYYALFRYPNIRHNQRGLPMITGRGCPYRCNFCYRMDKGFRPRRPQSIIDEIKILKERYGITYITFSDELLMSSEARTIELCDQFLKANLGINWYCNGRLNYASGKVLKLMKRAGCVFINYGIEAMDDLALEKMEKQLTTAQIIRGVENTLEAGISPGLNIIFGNLGESRETLMKGVEFLLKYDDMAQIRTIRPVTPYPGSPLYYYAIEKGLLKDCADFYEHKHRNSDLLSVNFTDMTDNEFHASLFEANKMLLENYFKKKFAASVEQFEKMYCHNDTSFRGLRHT